jgi:hypothetical protein
MAGATTTGPKHDNLHPFTEGSPNYSVLKNCWCMCARCWMSYGPGKGRCICQECPCPKPGFSTNVDNSFVRTKT